MRYGFHGLSYEYIASVLPQVDPKAAAGKTVVLHLGNGSSMCGMSACRSVASTMGFTAVDGLPMGTRCGNLDPGVVLYLMDELKMDVRAIEKLIYQQSGLLGVSGISSDMRALLASPEPRREAGDRPVRLSHRPRTGLARVRARRPRRGRVHRRHRREQRRAARARLPRRRLARASNFDPEANRAGAQRISRAGSRVGAFVVPTNEELMIARHTRAVLAAPAKERTP